MLTDELGRLESIQSRHPDVHQDHRKCVAQHRAKRFTSRIDLDHGMTQRSEHRANRHPLGRIVINEKNGRTPGRQGRHRPQLQGLVRRLPHRSHGVSRDVGRGCDRRCRRCLARVHRRHRTPFAAAEARRERQSMGRASELRCCFRGHPSPQTAGTLADRLAGRSRPHLPGAGVSATVSRDLSRRADRYGAGAPRDSGGWLLWSPAGRGSAAHRSHSPTIAKWVNRAS